MFLVDINLIFHTNYRVIIISSKPKNQQAVLSDSMTDKHVTTYNLKEHQMLKTNLRTHHIYLIFLLFFLNVLTASEVISGYILDAKNGEPLPAANLQIEGTLSGAITNRDGKFNMELDELPASIFITYIGYESKRITIKEPSESLLRIELTPIILEMEAIVVTTEDPAMNIMRKVIKKKQEWRKRLQTYQADAYSRIILENDSGIVTIAESISRAYWHVQKGPREVIISRKQTNNITQSENFATVSDIPNFYDDDIELIGFKMIGVTHPDAFDYYRFKLVDRRMRDDKMVYDIEVIPTSLLQPTFNGLIAVLDEEYVVLNVDLRPNESMLLPPPFQEWNLYYKQQFSDFGKDFWLPVDVRIDGDILIGFTGLQFPRIKFSQVSHLNDYEVNIPVPDSLYEEKKIVHVDSTMLDSTQLFVGNPDVIPLTEREDEAYQDIDSTLTMEKAFRPTGFLARMAGVDEDGVEKDTTESTLGKITKYFGVELWYNRVDALHAGLKFKQDLFKKLRFEILGAYNTGSKKWAYGLETKASFLEKNQLKLGVEFYATTHSQFSTQLYPWFMTSFLPIFAEDDYFDYYWREHVRGEITYNWRKADLDINAGFNHERHTNLPKTTDWNIIGKTYTQRENPQILEGILRSLDFKLVYGREKVPFGFIGNQYIQLSIEHSSPSLLNSDFNFTRYEGIVEWRFNTFLQRRMLPNALDFKIIGGFSDGDLPSQRYGALDGNLFAITPFGAFRTLNGRVYRGEKYAALMWEHNFRTVPFELLGLRSIAKKGIGIILHGAHGQTWIDDENRDQQQPYYLYSGRPHHEIGVSVNSILNFFRFDMTQRLDQKAFYIGVSAARMF